MHIRPTGGERGRDSGKRAARCAYPSPYPPPPASDPPPCARLRLPQRHARVRPWTRQRFAGCPRLKRCSAAPLPRAACACENPLGFRWVPVSNRLGFAVAECPGMPTSRSRAHSANAHRTLGESAPRLPAMLIASEPVPVARGIGAGSTLAGRPWRTSRCTIRAVTRPSPSCPRPSRVSAASPSRVAVGRCWSSACCGGREHRQMRSAPSDGRARSLQAFADLITRPRKILARAGACGFRDSGGGRY